MLDNILLTALSNAGSKTLFNDVFIRPEQVVHFLQCEIFCLAVLKFRSLPLKKLWAWLVSVACTQTGQQRLMATGLLLRVLLVSR